MEPYYSDDETGELVSNAPTYSRPAFEFQMSKLKELVSLYKEKLNDVEKIRTEQPCHPRAMAVEYQSYERAVGILELVTTSNQDLNKVLTVFTYLISEIKIAREYIDCNVVIGLNFYGEGKMQADQMPEGEAELMMGQMMPFFSEVFESLSYVNSLVVNLVTQLHSLYYKKQPKNHDLYGNLFKYVHLNSAFDALGKMLGGLAMIDSVVDDNQNLVNHWDLYKRMMQFAKNDPAKYGITDKLERQLRKCLLFLDKSILSGNCLQACLSHKGYEAAISSNKELQNEFLNYFKVKIDKLTNSIESQYEWQESKIVVDVICLYFLYRKLYPKDFDKKLFKSVWSLIKKAPVVCVTGQVIIYPHELIMKIAPAPKSVAVEPKDPEQYIKAYMQKSDDNLDKSMQSWLSKFSLWSSRMQSFLNSSTSLPENQVQKLQDSRGKLLLQGLLLAYQIQNYIQVNTALHERNGVPFKANFIPLLMQAIELTKAIHSTLERKQEIIALYLGSIIRLIFKDAIKPYDMIRDKLGAKPTGVGLDIISIYKLVNELGSGCLNSIRSDLLKLCNEIVDIKSILKENEKSLVEDGLWKFEILVEYQTNLKNSTDCSFIYWIQQLNTHFLKYIYDEPANVHRLRYLYMALEDSAKQMLLCRHVEDANDIKQNYIKDRENELVEMVIMPLARAIESDLRLHIHSLYITGIEKQNPFQSSNLSWFLDSQPMVFCEKVIDIKRKIEMYLDETFYNMTALNLNDWRTYEEMRSLARQKYKLNLSEVHLPSKHLDQGMDLLDITKKLPNFVNKFKYNLHSQFFIEATEGDEKHVALVSYMHITNSLRTHGLGLINTTINTSYRLLAKKFQIFSQFLYDDHVYSQLVKDRKFFVNNREALNQMYSYDRAENFLREVKKLGVFDKNLTLIDKFRILITQIGNTLGLIRMIKTAGLNLTATRTQFIPNTQNIPNITELAEKFSDGTKSAASSLEDIMESLTKNFTADTDYFKILVTTFQGVLNTNEASHLKLFYMIIPTLTISYVESMLTAKDKLTKKKALDMYFTDDGFAVGLAYVLRILEQESHFDSLHWFDSVETKFAQEEEKLTVIKASEEMQKMQNMSLKKISVFRVEFELLKYCFLGARIFFNNT
ncbi:hypothetical protein SteCoe_14412 [Stentor coeruleus]|uniref:Uncharacterized protein n=1 Tax=Stentor coeruleus TaxID=5963 RepID=A0A1R2C621_9CILI|nr:hypothetical protein SteCoe_14412 [Stentor coeruleus]